MSISLDMIQSGQHIKPPKITLMGVGGIGKTTFPAGDPVLGLRGAPKPVYLFTEESAGMLEMPAFWPRKNSPVLRTWEEILGAVGALYEGEHDYQTAVLDTIDFAEPMLWEHTARKYGEHDIESFGYGKGYVYACDEARVLLEGLDALRNDRGMAIVLLAHTTTKKYDAPDHEPYDRYKLRLQDRLAHLIHDWSDALLFAQWKVNIVRDKDDFDKNKSKARGVGKGERVMYTEERPAWWAKNRYRLPYEMPLSWEALEEAIAAGIVAKPPTEKPKTANRSSKRTKETAS